MEEETKEDKLKQEYYEKTAPYYDEMCIFENDEHYLALKYIISFVDLLNITSILDVGCGTGRGVKYFLEERPNIQVKGIEPSQALIEQAIQKNNVPANLIICGNGKALPFENNSFDAVCEFGVLHHIKEHALVVSEMIRVARKAVFLSDGNRFGQGAFLYRLLKLMLYKTNLWQFFYYIKTRGKGYYFSKEDGLFYSYSVFDSYDILAKWADRIILIPTSQKSSLSWYHPLLTSSHVLLCALKDGNNKKD